MSNTAQEILDAVGGPGNITHFTHCATRLRFELNDASIIDKDRVEAIDGVLGAVPQSGDRYQIVIGGAVQSVFNEINNLPSMKSGAEAQPGFSLSGYRRRCSSSMISRSARHSPTGSRTGTMAPIWPGCEALLLDT